MSLTRIARAMLLAGSLATLAALSLASAVLGVTNGNGWPH